jgi:hypothetical protein
MFLKGKSSRLMLNVRNALQPFVSKKTIFVHRGIWQEKNHAFFNRGW